MVIIYDHSCEQYLPIVFRMAILIFYTENQCIVLTMDVQFDLIQIFSSIHQSQLSIILSLPYIPYVEVLGV